MTKRNKILLASIFAMTLVGLCGCASTDTGTGFNAAGEEDAFDKQTDFENEQSEKLLELEQY
jgi:hypothetical protein